MSKESFPMFLSLNQADSVRIIRTIAAIIADHCATISNLWDSIDSSVTYQDLEMTIEDVNVEMDRLRDLRWTFKNITQEYQKWLAEHHPELAEKRCENCNGIIKDDETNDPCICKVLRDPELKPIDEEVN